MNRILYKTFFFTAFLFLLAISETSITNPEWTFSDDFESDTSKYFWKSKTSAARSVIPDSEAIDECHNSKVLSFKFNPGSNSWSELRFQIPIKAQQLEIEFDQYVPSNYFHTSSNQKGLALWSGDYGKPHFFAATEEWPGNGGAKPSKNLYFNNKNYGHDFLDSRGGLMWYDHQGRWQHMHFYIELAEKPGDMGVFEIYRNEEFLIGTHHLFMDPKNNDQICFSDSGNYIDQGYLMGWANGGFKEITEFYVDNFVIKANSVIGSTNHFTKKKSVSINAKQINDSTVVLMWNPSVYDSSDVVSLGVIYGISQYPDSINQTGYDTLMYNLEITSDTISGLRKGQKYYFSPFVLDSSGIYTMWKDDGGMSLQLVDVTPPSNDFTLKVVQLDSASVQLIWKKYRSIAKDADSCGIFYRTDLYPQSVSDQKAKKVKAYTIHNGTDTLKGLQTGIYYYFSLFVRDSSGNWSTSSDSSRFKLVLSKFAQNVPGAFSFSPDGSSDTIRLFGDTLKLWFSPDFTGSIRDTIDLLDASSLNKTGFVSAGPGFQFRTGGQIIKGSMYVSVLVGEPNSLNNEKLYIFDNLNNRWLLDTTSQKTGSTQNKRVTTIVKDLEFPRALLIDTMPPQLTVQHRARIVANGESFSEEITLIDNVYNCKTSMFASAGGETFVNVTSRISVLSADTTTKRMTVTVPGTEVSQCKGVKAMLTVFDGIQGDTVYISRPVARTSTGGCEKNVIPPMVWTPVLTTAVLGEPALGTAIARSTGAGADWTYDTKEMRIYRYHDADPSNYSSAGWLEYGPGNEPLFNLALGEVLWIKSRKSMILESGAGVVPTLLDTQKITINPHEWIDCAVPFTFDYPLSTLLEASAVGNRNIADSLEIYSWVKMDSIYYTTPFYLSKVENLKTVNRVLKANAAYSLFNPQNKAVTIKFPGICTVDSGTTTLRKKSTTEKRRGWSVAVSITRKEREYSNVYCGYMPGEEGITWYPIGPSFGTVPVALTDTLTGKKYGHCVYTGNEKAGMLFPITSDGSNEQVTLHIGAGCNVPDSIIIGFYNPVSQKLTQTIGTGSGNPKNGVVLVAGNAAYIGSLAQRFAPSRASISGITLLNRGKTCVINYSLPAMDYEYIRFNLFDLKGRCLIQNQINTGNRPGNNRHILSNEGKHGISAQGTYVVIMSVKFAQLEKVHQSARKVTLVR